MKQHIAHLLLILITGAITLSLEVIASRIMSPYFGVSLYIWAGILSITLIALAAGYYWGEILVNKHNDEKLKFLFLLFPAISTLCLLCARIVYPILFPILVVYPGIVLGSFIACIVFLGPVLILLSSINPILIKLLEKQNIGPGKVFCLSTVGSVLGVILTAFVLIPNITNSKGVLVLSIVLGVSSLVCCLMSSFKDKKEKIAIIAFAVLGILLNTLYLLLPYEFEQNFLWQEEVTNLKIVDTVPSFFGTIKVLDITKEDGNINRVFYQEGSNQSIFDAKTKKNVAEYIFEISNIMLSAFKNSKNILVLGLGAGAIPPIVEKYGMKSTVVEINPKAVEVAKKYFGYDDVKHKTYIEDARGFANKCNNEYDVVFVDLFGGGESIPDYVLTKNYFSDLKNKCLTKSGGMLVNTVVSKENQEFNKLFEATSLSVFSNLAKFISPQKENGLNTNNIYYVASDYEIDLNDLNVVVSDMPDKMKQRVSEILKNSNHIYADGLRGIIPATDDRNKYAFVYGKTLMHVKENTVPYHPRILHLN